MKIEFFKMGQVRLPTKAHHNDAGIDFYIPSNTSMFREELLKYNEKKVEFIDGSSFTISGKSIMIPSLLKFKIPRGYSVVFFNRSSIASKQHLQVGACVIDEGYRDQVFYHLFVIGKKPILRYDSKIVQGLLIKVPKVKIKEIEYYEYTFDRGGGFGSTDEK